MYKKKRSTIHDREPLLRKDSSNKRASSPLETKNTNKINSVSPGQNVSVTNYELTSKVMGHYGSRGNSIGSLPSENVETLRYGVNISESQEEHLRKTYFKLALLSPNDIFINNKTFCHYFQLEEIFIKKLFLFLDYDKSGKISWEEFLNGIAACLYGNNDQKCHLLFDVFQSSKSKHSKLSEADVTTFASSAVKTLLRFCLCYEKPEGYKQKERALTRELSKSLGQDAFVDISPSYSKENEYNTLSLKQFTNWLKRYPSIIEAYFNHPSLLILQISSSEETDNPPSPVAPKQFKPSKPSIQTWMKDYEQETIATQAEVSTDHFQMVRKHIKYEWRDLMPALKQNHQLTKSPPTRSRHAAVEYNGYVYVYGGSGKHRTLKDLWRYSLEDQTWESVKASGRHPPPVLLEHSGILHENFMFIFGGAYSHDDVTAPLWCLNLESHEWETIPGNISSESPINRRGHSSVQYNNSMYVFGGYFDALGATDQMWKYDLECSSWSTVAISNNKSPSPLSRYFHDATVHGHAMWVYGGLHNLERLNDFWRFDFELLSWLRVKCRQNPPPLYGHQLCTVGKQLFLLGGYSDAVEPTNNLWSYDFDTYTWSRINQLGEYLPPERAHHVVIPVPQHMIKHSTNQEDCHENKDTTLKTSCRHIAKELIGTLSSCAAIKPRLSHSEVAPFDISSFYQRNKERSRTQLLLIGGQSKQSNEIFKQQMETWLLDLGYSNPLDSLMKDTSSTKPSSVLFVNSIQSNKITNSTLSNSKEQLNSNDTFCYSKLNNPTAVNI